MRLALTLLGATFATAAAAQPAPPPSAQATPSDKSKAEAGTLRALAKASLTKGELPKAIELFTKAIGIDASHAETWFDRGNIRLAEGKFELALADFDKGLGVMTTAASTTDRAGAHVQRARANLKIGKHQAAMADFDQAVKLIPRSPLALAYRAFGHAAGNADDKALADAEQAMALAGFKVAPAPLAWAVRAQILASRQRYKEAEVDLRALAKESSDTATIVQAVRSVYTIGTGVGTPMTLRIVRAADPHCEPSCPEWIALQGRIVKGQQDDFAELLGRVGKKKLPVFIDSQGGNVDAATAIGRMIRTRDLDVVVARTELSPCTDATCRTRTKDNRVLGTATNIAARCASACVQILAAGSQRIVGTFTAVGVHRITFYRKYATPPDAERLAEDRRKGRIIVTTMDGPQLLGAGDDETYVKTRQYYRDMDVDESIMEYLLAAPRDGMSWLSMTDLVSTRLATGSGLVEQYLSGAPPPPPVVTLPPPMTVPPAASRDDLVRDINRELVRLGCMVLASNLTEWNGPARAALARYGTLMGRTMSTKEPAQVDLDTLRRHKRAVCPSACPDGATAQEKFCVMAAAKKS